MKTCIATWTLAAATAVGIAPAAARAQNCTPVEVQNVRPRQGFLMIAAYGSAEAFLKTPSVSMKLAAAEGTMRFELCGASGKDVALLIYQDLDGNGQMARNLIGLPSEPWGSSGAPGPFGPSWDSSKVPLDSRVIAVTMSS